MAFQYAKVSSPTTSAVTLNSTGTATLLTSALDTSGYKSVRIIVRLGTIASGGGFSTAEIQSSISSAGTYAAVTGLQASGTQLPTTGDSNKNMVFEWDLINGKERFYKLYLVGAGTNKDTAVQNIQYVLGDPIVQPVSTANTADFVVRL